jgi:DNA-binding transcriptional LysR family regulator
VSEHLQISRLEGFYWVAKERGYAAAARVFPYPITQPAVFQQVKKLEEELGCTLFERVSKDTLALTAEGRRLYDFCAPFLEELPRVVRDLRAGARGGELRIDSVGLAIRSLLPQWIKSLRAERPDIRVSLEEIAQPEPSRLRSGLADLIVDYLPALPRDIDSLVVGRARAFLVAPAERYREAPALEELAEEAFVSYPAGSHHHELQLAALHRYGVVPERTLAAASSDSILRFVGAGLGFSLVPWLGEDGPTQEGSVVARALDDADATFPIHAAFLRRTTPNPLISIALQLAPQV